MKLKQFNYVFVTILILLVSVVVYAQNNVPDLIVEKSNQFIISKVGQDFFSKHITIDYSRSKYYPPDEFCIKNPDSCEEFLQKPYYLMVYSFKMPEKLFVDELIEFAVDTEGNIIPERDIMGIPDCINTPKNCEFSIDETKAAQIARRAGLELGISDWEISFHWFTGDLKTYVWTVQNTLSATPSGQAYSANGKTVVIDASSGEVKDISQWTAITSSKPKSRTQFIDIDGTIPNAIIALFIVVFVVMKIMEIVKKNKKTRKP